MRTLCSRCDNVLTNEKGERVESGHFDSRLNHLKRKDTGDITYAWCEICYAEALLNTEQEHSSECEFGCGNATEMEFTTLIAGGALAQADICLACWERIGDDAKIVIEIIRVRAMRRGVTLPVSSLEELHKLAQKEIRAES